MTLCFATEAWLLYAQVPLSFVVYGLVHALSSFAWQCMNNTKVLFHFLTLWVLRLLFNHVPLSCKWLQPSICVVRHIYVNLIVDDSCRWPCWVCCSCQQQCGTRVCCAQHSVWNSICGVHSHSCSQRSGGHLQRCSGSRSGCRRRSSVPLHPQLSDSHQNAKSMLISWQSRGFPILLLPTNYHWEVLKIPTWAIVICEYSVVGQKGHTESKS